MKKLKIIGIVAVSLVAAFYIIYLFVLPNVIDLTFAKNMIKDLAKDNAGVEVNIDKINLTTGFPLTAGAKISGVNLICADKTQPVKLNFITANANLLPLLFKRISVSDIEIDALEAETSVSKDGKFAIEKCFVFPEKTDTQEEASNTSFDFKLAERLPVVSLTNTKVSLKDDETNNKLILNVNDLILDNATLNKKFRVTTNGNLHLNDKENMKFSVTADSFMPEFSVDEKEEQTKADTPYFNFIKEFEKYNLLADINADLKIRKKQDKIVMKGFANIDGLSFKIGKEQLPASFVHTKFTPKQGELNSEIFISKNEKFSLSGLIKNSNVLDLETSFNTDKISFSNLQKIAVAVLSTLNIQNNIDTFKTNGYIVSNLQAKTNSKTLKSSGHLSIKNGEIISDKLGLFIKKLNSDIDLSNNAITITNTSVSVNDAVITAKGTIDENANADISLSTEKLPIAKLAQAFLTGDLQNNYNIKKGLLDLNLLVKGRLDKIKPEITAKLATLEIFDKVNKMTVSNNATTAKITTDGKTFNGDVVLSDTKVLLPSMGVNVAVPTLKADILPENINIANSKIVLNNSTFNLSGGVKNYMKTPDIGLKLNGSIVSGDLKKFIPKEYASMVIAKGSMPIKAVVSGSDKISVNAQIFANSSNNLNFMQIDKLNNKNTITNADILLNGNTISIKDVGIYLAGVNSLSDDLKNNLLNGKSIITANGALVNGNTLKNFKVDINDTLGIKIFGISTNAKGNLEVNGNLSKPQLKGTFNLTNTNAPDYLIKNQVANIVINPNTINLELLGLDLNGSVLDAKISMLSDFTMPMVVTNASIDAQGIDLDKVLVITSKLSAPASAATSAKKTTAGNSQLIPVTIKSGSAKIDLFKIATLSASNITSDFTLAKDVLDMKNLNATAYDGKLTGNIKYNLNTLKMDAKLNGENMSANPAISALIGIKDQITGTLKFNADISLKGATIQEQLGSLNGKASFEVKDGQMGSLGKFETYLKAANIISSSILNLTINKIIAVVLPYNSGQIATATGNLTFGNGNVNFNAINTSGKEMGLHITGSLNMLNYKANMIILGRLNQEMTSILGALGDLSVDKIAGYIPVVGKLAPSLLKIFNAVSPKDDISAIPQLTPNASSKTFKVVINGSIMSANFVKSFQWLTTENVYSSTEQNIQQKFTIPATKEAIVSEVKTQIEEKKQTAIEEAKKKQEEVKTKIENSKAVQNAKILGEFIKTRVEAQKNNASSSSKTEANTETETQQNTQE